ncbi:hypothetical protein F5Y01DRAFT_324468 [Xylaria sp. FL0043]|nr:hypothetical protein F5Y01DRAFT_324468 [Xylaria sp. FL0043]
MLLSLGAIRIVAISTIAFALSIAALVLRLWSRRILRDQLQFNDYMIIFASIVNAGAYATTLTACVVGGLGVHVQEVLATYPQYYDNYVKIFVATGVLWCTANTCVKFSILSLYQILFPTNIFVRVCRGMMLLSAAYWTMVSLEIFLICKPIQYTWDKTIPGGTCYNQRLAYLSAAIVNLIIDATIVILPMPLIFGLQLTFLKRMGVVGMFSLGGLVCVISLDRVLWVSTWDLCDLTFGVVNVTVYTMLEPFLGVVNACLPVIKPALIKIFNSGAQRWPSRKPASPETASTPIPQGCTLPPSYAAYFGPLHDEFAPASVHATKQDVHNADTEEHNTITITRGWEVNSRSDYEAHVP